MSYKRGKNSQFKHIITIPSTQEISPHTIIFKYNMNKPTYARVSNHWKTANQFKKEQNSYIFKIKLEIFGRNIIVFNK